MDYVKLVETTINMDELLKAVSSPKCGAISSFLGTTRDNFEGKKVVRLEYEAYHPMAISETKKICAQIREMWNVEHIAIVHRLGTVPVTESSIAIVISSPHRKESLEAVAYAIDEMKSKVPIWKKEIYDDGDGSEWKANKECSWSNNPEIPNAKVNGVQ
jgi:molybdopterin synthase catalytic subunit